MKPSLEHRSIIGIRVDATDYPDAAERILAWAKAGESRYVCVTNVHVVMEAYDAPEFLRMVNDADLVTPDGMPLVWALRLLGIQEATRVDGATLTFHVCEAAAKEGVPIALYGGAEETLAAFTAFVKRQFPGIQIVAAISPPYRPLTPQEEAEHVEQLTRSGARILLVSLGCPKQERWIAEHRGWIPAVMLGIGAALDFHAGRIPRAPRWMQRAGLEWLFRLLMEPRRLWRRYWRTIPRFLWLFLLQLLGLRKFNPPAPGAGEQ